MNRYSLSLFLFVTAISVMLSSCKKQDFSFQTQPNRADLTEDIYDLRSFVQGAAVGIAGAIIIATIVEDFATAGVGVGDDLATFTLAYRIYRLSLML